MSLDDELLLLRLGLSAILLLFVLLAGLTMRAGLRPPPPAVERPRVRMARLVVVAPGESGLPPGTEFAVAGEMTVGRDPRSGIVLGDSSVSSRHALIAPAGRGWQLRDLGSTNGTLVSGRPVDARGAILRGGEEVVFGSVAMRFYGDG